MAAGSASDRIRRIHERVRQVRASEEVGVRYLQAWEEKYYEWERGKEEGKAEGKAEGHAEGKAESVLELLGDLPGTLPEEVCDRILQEKDLVVLKRYLKLAASSGTVEDFIRRMEGF